jgi:hypothetical protein
MVGKTFAVVVRLSKSRKDSLKVDYQVDGRELNYSAIWSKQTGTRRIAHIMQKSSEGELRKDPLMFGPLVKRFSPLSLTGD